MNTEEIISNWKKIASSLKEFYNNNDVVFISKIKLFRRLLMNLPETTLVDREYLDENALIMGTVDLFTEKEFYLLKGKRKNISFVFEEYAAHVYEGHYKQGTLLFSSNWTEALEFILEEIIKMPEKKALTDNQEIATNELIKQLKIKKGS